jgi:hypothetical protein
MEVTGAKVDVQRGAVGHDGSLDTREDWNLRLVISKQE